METITESWTKITDWLRSNLPEALHNLRPPASDKEIEEAEKSLGISFPTALKELYRLHDGEKNNWPPGVFDDGHWFMPLAEIVEHKKMMAEFAEYIPADSFDSWKSSVEEGVISIKGPVKPHNYSHSWIPLTTSNGDVHRYLDFDPAPGGNAGQIIEQYTEACSHKVLASSLEEYLNKYSNGLLSGRYVVKDDCIVDTQEDPEDSWDLPEYLEGIEYEYITESDISQPFQLKELESGKQVEVIGQMNFLMGGSDEIIFSIFVSGGKEYSFLATTKETKGYGAIAIDQYAKVSAIKNKVTNKFTEGFGTDSPELLALEYKMVKGPDVKLQKRPWWKRW